MREPVKRFFFWASPSFSSFLLLSPHQASSEVAAFLFPVAYSDSFGLSSLLSCWVALLEALLPLPTPLSTLAMVPHPPQFHLCFPSVAPQPCMSNSAIYLLLLLSPVCCFPPLQAQTQVTLHLTLTQTNFACH